MSLVPPIVLPPPANVAGRDYELLPPIDWRAPTRVATRRLGASDAVPSPLSAHARSLYSELPTEDDEAAFLHEAFVLSRSCVVAVSDAHLPMATVLSALASASDTTPPAMFAVRADWPARAHEQRRVWVVYGSHDEAAASLLLSHPQIARIEPALASDLEPHTKLQRVALALNPPRSPTSSTTSSGPATPVEAAMPVRTRSRFTLSSNPPNAKISYRPGDWICTVPGCEAYNFARNMACISCGHPNPYHAHAHTHAHGPHAHPAVHPTTAPLAHGALPNIMPNTVHPAHLPPQHQSFISPRFAQDAQRRRPPFASLPGSRSGSPPTPLPPPRSPPSLPLHSHSPALSLGSKPHAPTYPLLTPSGHALSAGGRVRNVSLDPGLPCVMYWPDNEPLPERGQIRPSGSQAIQYPPIVNTGNKGAAEKQPGDWTCSKCHYLNWRRRKVCQTCFPYAEGNGDSISQAVQAERIALLTNLLNQTESALPALHRRASMPLHQAPFTPPRHAPHASLGAPAHRSRSQADLRGSYTLPPQQQQQLYQQTQRPIYQTSRHSSPARSLRAPSPGAAFLPACLYNDVGSSQSSPASASSGELAFDEFGFSGYSSYPSSGSPGFSSGFSAFGEAEGGFEGADAGAESEEEVRFRAPGGATRSSGGRKVFPARGEESIWSLDGDESRTLRPYAPIHAEMAELERRLAGLATGA